MFDVPKTWLSKMNFLENSLSRFFPDVLHNINLHVGLHPLFGKDVCAFIRMMSIGACLFVHLHSPTSSLHAHTNRINPMRISSTCHLQTLTIEDTKVIFSTCVDTPLDGWEVGVCGTYWRCNKGNSNRIPYWVIIRSDLCMQESAATQFCGSSFMISRVTIVYIRQVRTLQILRIFWSMWCLVPDGYVGWCGMCEILQLCFCCTWRKSQCKQVAMYIYMKQSCIHHQLHMYLRVL